jgi:hypothetical protein
MSDVTYNKLYLYDHVFQLLMVGDTICCPTKDNGPMNKIPLKAHKGIDNKLIFRVLDPDRRPVDVSCGKQVYARIINPDNRTIVLEKLCRLGPAKGLVNLYLDSGDLAPIDPGLFTMVLISTEQFVVGSVDEYVQKPLYSDLNDNVSMEIEITEQALKTPLPSYVLEPKDWTPDILMPLVGQPQPCFYSKRIPGSRIQNHINSVHSFSTYTEDFTGVLEIWGSLEEAPDPYVNDIRWFKIYPSTFSQDIQFVCYTGTQAWTFAENCMWIKFRYFPSTQVLYPGILKKVIVRT